MWVFLPANAARQAYISATPPKPKTRALPKLRKHWAEATDPNTRRMYNCYYSFLCLATAAAVGRASAIAARSRCSRPSGSGCLRAARGLCRKNTVVS